MKTSQTLILLELNWKKWKKFMKNNKLLATWQKPYFLKNNFLVMNVRNMNHLILTNRSILLRSHLCQNCLRSSTRTPKIEKLTLKKLFLENISVNSYNLWSENYASPVNCSNGARFCWKIWIIKRCHRNKIIKRHKHNKTHLS